MTDPIDKYNPPSYNELDDSNPSDTKIRYMRSYGYIYRKRLGAFTKRRIVGQTKTFRYTGDWVPINRFSVLAPREYEQNPTVHAMWWNSKAEAEAYAKKWILIANEKSHIRERLLNDIKRKEEYHSQVRPTITLYQSRLVPFGYTQEDRDKGLQPNAWTIELRKLIVKVPVKRLMEKRHILIGSKDFKL